MTDDIKPKLQELLNNGFEDTGKKFTHKGKELPVYGKKDDITAIVYDFEKDKIVWVYRFQFPYKVKGSESNERK